MRIKEAISRRRLIQQLNDEYAEEQRTQYAEEQNAGKSSLPNYSGAHRGQHDSSTTTAGGAVGADSGTGEGFSRHDSVDITLADHHRAYLQLQEFVQHLNSRLSEGHRRALRVTWKRLSEAPKTSGRGNLQIMEKVFAQLVDGSPDVMSVFYRSAFLKCVDDRLRGCQSGTIATLRDHAHLLIDLIDGIMSLMFDAPLQKPVWDPATIGRAHARLLPMGFEQHIWHRLGECLAEVMFSQECVRAYPHAASAWSMLSVSITDKMYSHSRIAVGELLSNQFSFNHTVQRSTENSWRGSHLVLNGSTSSPGSAIPRNLLSSLSASTPQSPILKTRRGSRLNRRTEANECSGQAREPRQGPAPFATWCE